MHNVDRSDELTVIMIMIMKKNIIIMFPVRACIFDMDFQKQWELEAELLYSAETGDISRLRQLLVVGVDINVQDKVRQKSAGAER